MLHMSGSLQPPPLPFRRLSGVYLCTFRLFAGCSCACLGEFGLVPEFSDGFHLCLFPLEKEESMIVEEKVSGKI